MEIETKDATFVLSIPKLETPSFPFLDRHSKSVKLLSEAIAGSEVHRHAPQWNDSASSLDDRLHISHLILIHCYKEIRRARYLAGLSHTFSFSGFFKDWAITIHRFNVKGSALAKLYTRKIQLDHRMSL